MTQALEFDDVAGGGKGEPGSGLVFIVEHFGKEHLRACDEAAAGHLLGIAHQFIEVNFWGGDKGSDAASTLDDSFAFEEGKSVARGHEADLMNFGEVALRGNGITGMQLSAIDALAEGAGCAPRVFRGGLLGCKIELLPRQTRCLKERLRNEKARQRTKHGDQQQMAARNTGYELPKSRQRTSWRNDGFHAVK